MAKDKVEKEVILNVTTNADEATLKIDKLTEGVKKNTEATEKNAEAQEDLAKETKKTEKEVDSLGKTFGDNTLVTKTLDTATGGLYSTFKDGIGQVRQLSSGMQSYSSAQKVAKTTTDATNTSIKGMKTAIIATGIGAFIVVLATLVEKFDLINKLVGSFKGPNIKDFKSGVDSINEEFDMVEKTYNNLAITRKYSEDKITQDLIRLRVERYEAIKKLTDKQRSEVEESQKKWYNKLYKFLLNDWEVSNGFESKSTELRNQEEIREVNRVANLANLESEVEIVRLQAEKDNRDRLAREQALQKEQEVLQRKRELDTEYAITQEEKFNSAFFKIQQEYEDALKKNRILVGQELEEANKITRDYYNNQKTLLQDQETLWKTFNETFKGDSVATVVNILDLFKGGEEAVKAFKNTYKEVLDIEEIGEFIQGIETNLDRIKAITDSHNAEILDINRAKDIEGLESLKRFKLDELQELEDKNIKELESLNASEDAKLQVYLYYANERTKVEEEASEKSKAILDKKTAYYLAMADGISGILDGLSTASKEGSSIQKGLAIASVALDTGVAAISAFKGMTASFPGPKGITLGYIASAGIALQGLNQINQLKKIKTDGTETGGSATASATMTPNVQFVSSADNQISNTIAEVSPEDTGPIKAYVVSSEVTTSQQLERNAVESSSL